MSEWLNETSRNKVADRHPIVLVGDLPDSGCFRTSDTPHCHLVRSDCALATNVNYACKVLGV
jgi:hypothetical protein